MLNVLKFVRKTFLIILLEELFQVKCEPFFFHSRKTKMIEIGLDNPNKECVLVKSDYKYMVYILKKQKTMLLDILKGMI